MVSKYEHSMRGCECPGCEKKRAASRASERRRRNSTPAVRDRPGRPARSLNPYEDLEIRIARGEADVSEHPLWGRG